MKNLTSLTHSWHLFKEDFIINIKFKKKTFSNLWILCIVSDAAMLLKTEQEEGSVKFLVHSLSPPCAWGRLGVEEGD